MVVSQVRFCSVVSELRHLVVDDLVAVQKLLSLVQVAHLQAEEVLL